VSERVDLGAAVARYTAAVQATATAPQGTLAVLADSCRDVPALLAEVRELRAALDHHHNYIAGLTGKEPCLICRIREHPEPEAAGR
jgi:hypothetical protein